MFELILHPFAVAIAWVWYMIHRGLVLLGLPSGSSYAWVISIVLVTIAVRVLIIPLYLKQINSSRSMQAITPEIRKIQAKYKGKTDPASRQRMTEETQALYKKHGANPLASCLPVLVQMPILFAMYRVFLVVKDIADGIYTYQGEPASALGPIDQALAREIDGSTVAGVFLSTTLGSAGSAGAITAFVILIALMVVLQFVSMKMMMDWNMPPNEDPNNPMVRTQKMMLYMVPGMFIFTGFIFQMGVLVYMVTGTVWAVLQQIWVLKVMPTPGSRAYNALVEKRQKDYQSWARAYFTEYEKRRSAAGSDEAAVAELNATTLREVQTKAKSARIASNFPEAMSDGEILTVYRNLSTIEWTTLPDEIWMRGVHRQTEKSVERRAQAERREQPKRTSKAQRKAERSRRDASATGSDLGGLTPEERERRRQERRKAERERRKKNR